MESGTIENAQISQLLRSGTPESLNSNADVTLDDFIEPILSQVEVFDGTSTTYRSTKTGNCHAPIRGNQITCQP